MNTERLNAIARGLRDDLAQTNAADLLTQLRDALQQQVANPADPSAQQQVSNLRTQLEEALSAAPSNRFPPTWAEALEELGVADFFGDRLRERARAIFERNNITPNTAHEEFGELTDRVSSIRTSLDNLVAALDAFHVGAEELGSGEYEVGVMIPRAAVSNELGALADELRELDQILLPFSELITGSRPDYDIRSISSSAFLIFLNSPGAVAVAIAHAIDKLVDTYKKLLEIRVAHKTLKDTGVSKTQLKGVTEYADSYMEKGIGELVEELITAYGEHLDGGRANELRIELRVSLNGLANRIDRGYHVEVRAGLPPPEVESDEEGERGDPGSKDRRYYEAIANREEGLQFVKLSGNPILSLPESKAEPDDDEGPASAG